MTSMGKYRHLSQNSTTAGHFAILAIDHRTNLLDDLNRHAERPLTDAEFTAFKRSVVDSMVDHVTAVLIDPAYGLGVGIAQRYLRGQVGLLAPLEVTDYSLHASRRTMQFISGWSVEKIKLVGASGVKLLLPYHPQAADAADKHSVVQQLADQCAAYDIPFFLEPIAFSLNPSAPLDNAELQQVSVAMARQFSQMGVDVLKLQFPVDAKQSHDPQRWRAACDELNAACGDVPWALLSAGVDYPTFRQQAETACRAGASGVIVGRAVWGDAVTLQGEERQTFIQTTALERMQELAQICADLAMPWYARVAAPASALNWYEQYLSL